MSPVIKSCMLHCNWKSSLVGVGAKIDPFANNLMNIQILNKFIKLATLGTGVIQL